MTGWTDGTIWAIIVALGVGTFVIRFSFLGLLGDRDLPEWVLRHLRYTAVAILPALVTPMVLWPNATAAILALAVGYLTKNAIATIATGLIALFALQALGI